MNHDDHDGEHSDDHSSHGTGHVESDADHGDHDHGTCDDHSDHDDHDSHNEQTHPHGDIDYNHHEQPVTNHDDHDREHLDDDSDHGTGYVEKFAIAHLHHTGNHVTHFPNRNGTVDDSSLHQPGHATPDQAAQMVMPNYVHSTEPNLESSPDCQSKKNSKSGKPQKPNQENSAASDQGISNRHTGFHLTDQGNKRYSTTSMMGGNH
jgi:hypothetical protein